MKQVYQKVTDLRTPKQIIPDTTSVTRRSGSRAIFPPNVTLKTRHLTTTRTIGLRQNPTYHGTNFQRLRPPHPRQGGSGRTKPTSKLLMTCTRSNHGIHQSQVPAPKALPTMRVMPLAQGRAPRLSPEATPLVSLSARPNPLTKLYTIAETLGHISPLPVAFLIRIGEPSNPTGSSSH